MNADKELELRLPVKAGTRLVTAAFTDAAPSPENLFRARARGGPGDAEGNAPGVDMLYVSGPFNGKTPDGHAEPPADLHLPARAGAARRGAVRAEDHHGARAPRLPSAGDRRRCRAAARDLKEGRGTRDFDAGIERALEALLSSPKFLMRVEREPAGTATGAGLSDLSDLELASRLSFFLWRSIPDDELLEVAARRAAEGAGRARRAGRAHARRQARRSAS